MWGLCSPPAPQPWVACKEGLALGEEQGRAHHRSPPAAGQACVSHHGHPRSSGWHTWNSITTAWAFPLWALFLGGFPEISSFFPAFITDASHCPVSVWEGPPHWLRCTCKHMCSHAQRPPHCSWVPQRPSLLAGGGQQPPQGSLISSFPSQPLGWSHSTISGGIFPICNSVTPPLPCTCCYHWVSWGYLFLMT